MRIFLIISFFLSSSLAHAQKTIKVRKGKTLQGFYQLQTENKTKEFLYFDNKGNIAIIISKKRKKAKGNLVSCVENDNCQTAKKTTYKIDSLEISFTNSAWQAMRVIRFFHQVSILMVYDNFAM